MPKIKILFPQICFESRTIEVSEEEATDIMEGDRVKFIWDQMTQEEQDWCPDQQKGLESAYDVGYISVKVIE